MRIAYLGPETTYTHQAALKVTKRLDSTATLEPRTTIADVFSAVQHGEVDRGVVPFENSSNGCVVFTLDLFADLKRSHPDLIVTDEEYVPVQHCLLGRARKTASGELDLSHITRLYSHPQAWGQCKVFLDKHLQGVEQRDASSTAKGAEIVAAEGHETTSAAISSSLAADVTGLDVLASSIEDRKGNTTRFLVLQRLDAVDLKRVLPRQLDLTTHKTMVAFTVDNAAPGSLVDALAIFKNHNLNLANINTRPSGQQRWTYMFFVELWGRKYADEHKNAVNDALAELKALARSYRWLGSWQSALEDSAQCSEQ